MGSLWSQWQAIIKDRHKLQRHLEMPVIVMDKASCSNSGLMALKIETGKGSVERFPSVLPAAPHKRLPAWLAGRCHCPPERGHVVRGAASGPSEASLLELLELPRRDRDGAARLRLLGLPGTPQGHEAGDPPQHVAHHPDQLRLRSCLLGFFSVDRPSWETEEVITDLLTILFQKQHHFIARTIKVKWSWLWFAFVCEDCCKTAYGKPQLCCCLPLALAMQTIMSLAFLIAEVISTGVCAMYHTWEG